MWGVRRAAKPNPPPFQGGVRGGSVREKRYRMLPFRPKHQRMKTGVRHHEIESTLDPLPTSPYEGEECVESPSLPGRG